MKKSIFLILATILCATNAWAWCGNSFITVNGLWCTGSNSFVHDGGKFDGKDLGTLTALELGGELQVWPGSEEAATMYYSIDNAEAVAISLPKTGNEGENSKHSGSATVDLSSLAAGEHTLAVWFNHGSDWDSNNSNNFVATFTTPEATTPEPEYDSMELTMTNLVAEVADDFSLMTFKGSDDMNGIEATLVTGISLRIDQSFDFALSAGDSELTYYGTPLTISEGIVRIIDADAFSNVYAELIATLEGMGTFKFMITMTAGAAGGEEIGNITVEEAEIAPGEMDATILELYGYTADGKEVLVELHNGPTKMYDDYAADELTILVDWEEVALKEGTTASFFKEGDLAVLEATIGEESYLYISGPAWINPADIEPVATEELSFVGGKVKYAGGGISITGTQGNIELNIKLNATTDDMYRPMTVADFFYGSQITINEEEIITFLHGTLQVTAVGEDHVVTASLLGSNYVLYNITLTTSTVTTGVDNITTSVAPAKVIKNGQLIIINNGVQYNAQGQMVK